MTKPSRQLNRTLILEALPATQQELMTLLTLDRTTVYKWLKSLIESKEAYQSAWIKGNLGGVFIRVYSAGPPPPRFKLRSPEKVNDVASSRRYRDKLRESGEWEENLSRMRHAWHKKNHRIPPPDPLAIMFNSPV